MKALLHTFLIAAALGTGAARASDVIDESVGEEAFDQRFYCRVVYVRHDGRRERFLGSSRRSQERAQEKAMELCRAAVREPERCELRRCWMQ